MLVKGVTGGVWESIVSKMRCYYKAVCSTFLTIHTPKLFWVDALSFECPTLKWWMHILYLDISDRVITTLGWIWQKYRALTAPHRNTKIIVHNCTDEDNCTLTPGPSLSWKNSKFHGTCKNWLGVAILNIHLIQSAVHYYTQFQTNSWNPKRVRRVTSSLGPLQSYQRIFQNSVECVKIGRTWPF